MIGDQLVRGGFGAAGELGHLRVVPDGLPCGCGARGCIEQYGSGRALLRMANEIADAGGIGTTLATARRDAGELTGGMLAQFLADGDPGALHALRQLGHWLGQACASLGAVLDPELFVFGGGVSVAGELLLEPVRESYLAHLPARGYHPEPRFVVAELVNDAGVVGAADLARIHAAAIGAAPRVSLGEATARGATMFYWLMKNLVIGPILLTVFRPWVRGIENVPRSGPVILASNHLSFVDSIFLPLVLDRRVVFLAKSDYFTGRGLKGWLTKMFFEASGQLPIDRSGGKASEASLNTGLRVLAEGRALGIYPEGTRSPDGILYRVAPALPA